MSKREKDPDAPQIKKTRRGGYIVTPDSWEVRHEKESVVRSLKDTIAVLAGRKRF